MLLSIIRWWNSITSRGATSPIKESVSAVYDVQTSAQEMAVIAMRRSAEIRDAKLDYILKDMETDIRRAAEGGHCELPLSGCPQYIITGNSHTMQEPERYSRKDYAPYFERYGYRIIVRNKRSYLTWEPKPEPMDE